MNASAGMFILVLFHGQQTLSPIHVAIAQQSVALVFLYEKIEVRNVAGGVTKTISRMKANRQQEQNDKATTSFSPAPQQATRKQCERIQGQNVPVSNVNFGKDRKHHEHDGKRCHHECISW